MEDAVYDGAVAAALAVVAAGAVVIFTGSVADRPSVCLAISEGSWGAVDAVVDVAAPAAALSAVLNHGSFGADLQPIALQLITRAKLNVITLTRMASVPSNRCCLQHNLRGHAGLSGYQGRADRSNSFCWHDCYNPYYWFLSATMWVAEQ